VETNIDPLAFSTNLLLCDFMMT